MVQTNKKVMMLNKLEQIIYDYIKSKNCSVISWWIRLHLEEVHDLKISTSKINYRCSKLIALNLIERDRNPIVSEKYGIQYLLKNEYKT